MFGLGHESDYYQLEETIVYYSKRYDKTITVLAGYYTDGASGALDICEKAWTVHDWLCGNWAGKGPRPYGGLFDDDTKCNNWQASAILSDILKEEGFWFRTYSWRVMTWLFGGGIARKNGMY